MSWSVLLAATLVGASLLPATATEPAPPVAARTAPVFQPAPCPFRLPAGQVEEASVECGYVVVPEDRSDPGSASIRLATAVFHPAGGARHPDAVMYLEGGPGGSPLKLVGTLRDFETLYAPFVESGRDLVLIDQRGVGFSEPALECPRFSELYLDLLDQRLGDDPERLGADRMRALKVDALASCAAELRDTADLADYNTAAIAADVEDVRRALGYEQLNLWGTSYGTWAALDTMRDFPGSVRSAILDAPLTPEADPYVEAPASLARALDEVFRACADESACAKVYPDLERVFAATVEQLDAEPELVDILDPVHGRRVDLLIDGPTFLELVFRALYQAPMRAALPRIVHDARDGVFDTILTVAQIDVLRQDFRSWGMYYSVLCHDEVPFSSVGAFAASAAAYPLLASMYTDFELGPLPFELCPLWGAGVAPPVEAEPIQATIPTLLLTGQYDPIVPPSWGQRAAGTLAAATFFEFPGLAHGVSGDPCATEMMLAFLEEPASQVEPACMASMPIASFDLPAAPAPDVVLAPFRSEAARLQGVRPDGWDEVALGQYVRGAGGTDPTSLVLAWLPLSFDETLALLGERFGLAGPPQPLATVQGDALDWTTYQTDAQGVAIEFAVAPSGEASVIAVLTSTQVDRDRLVETVLLPVVAELSTIDPGE